MRDYIAEARELEDRLGALPYISPKELRETHLIALVNTYVKNVVKEALSEQVRRDLANRPTSASTAVMYDVADAVVHLADHIDAPTSNVTHTPSPTQTQGITIDVESRELEDPEHGDTVADTVRKSQESTSGINKDGPRAPSTIPVSDQQMVSSSTGSSISIAPEIKLSNDQKVALEKLLVWAKNDQPYFVLRGYAGTGKTFLMKLLDSMVSGIYFSAPTNKASKELSKSVGRTLKTTYSLLGLRMEPRDDKLVLTESGTPPYFPRGSIACIDEASMTGRELCRVVDKTRERHRLKILYTGDPIQLPPVGERSSRSWRSTDDPACMAYLREVLRYDNQILSLATALRMCVKEKNWESPISSDHDDTTGVWKWKNAAQFERNMLKSMTSGDDISEIKVIAWRNKTVDRYNEMIREALGFKKRFCVGDKILLAEPIESNGSLIAHTDDEFTVKDVYNSYVTTSCGVEIPVWVLHAVGDQSLILNVPRRQDDIDSLLTQKASAAKKATTALSKRLMWQDFWETKALFNKVRYGYAMTSHRAQGSTYVEVFVDQHDILCNPNKSEAYKCLYVSSTRPTTRLITF